MLSQFSRAPHCFGYDYCSLALPEKNTIIAAKTSKTNECRGKGPHGKRYCDESHYARQRLADFYMIGFYSFNSGRKNGKHEL